MQKLYNGLIKTSREARIFIASILFKIMISSNQYLELKILNLENVKPIPRSSVIKVKMKMLEVGGNVGGRKYHTFPFFTP
jgi:hypothetical protein